MLYHAMKNVSTQHDDTKIKISIYSLVREKKTSTKWQRDDWWRLGFVGRKLIFIGSNFHEKNSVER